MERYEALEPIRRGIREHFGGYEAGVGAGLTVRPDHGSRHTSRAFQAGPRFLGLASSPSYVREPGRDGASARFIWTLKEQLLWLERFEAVAALESFRRRYNAEWLVQKHNDQTPAQVRAASNPRAAA